MLAQGACVTIHYRSESSVQDPEVQQLLKAHPDTCHAVKVSACARTHAPMHECTHTDTRARTQCTCARALVQANATSEHEVAACFATAVAKLGVVTVLVVSLCIC